MNTTADGSIYWSILDLVKWDAALAKGEVLRPASWREAYTPAKLSSGNTYPYGFGWGLASANGHSIIEHSGGWQGFSTDIARYPDDKISVIILTNLANASPGTMARAIAEMLVPDLIERSIADKEPAATLAHRQLLESIIANHIDRQAFSAKAQKDLVPALEAAADRNKALGSIESFELLGRIGEGNSIRHRYLIKFKDKTAVLSIWVNAEGTVDQMRIQMRP